MESKRIDLYKYRGNGSTLFTGRPQGKEVRIELELDSIDANNENIIFLIPHGTTSFNPSFYLGLLFNSIEKLGKENFLEKYSFDYSKVDEEYLSIIEDD